MTNPFLLALVSVSLSVAAQFALRAGMQGAAGVAPWLALLRPMVLFGFVLYGASAVVWLSVLARWEVSKAYPLVGLGFVLSALIGMLVGEDISAQRWLGVGLITAGVWLAGRS